MKKNQIAITTRQAQQFNLMREVLRRIAKDYQSPNELRKGSEKQYGIGYEEAIQYAYENIQGDAAFAVKGVKGIAIPTLTAPAPVPGENT